MNESDLLQKKLTLRGRENFIEWMKRFQGLVDLDGWGTFTNGSFTEASPAKGKTAKKWVLMNINDDAIAPVDVAVSLQEILEKLNETFGFSLLFRNNRYSFR